MKTTVELPPELLRRLKAEAAMQGRSMKQLLVEAVREKLSATSRTRSGWRSVFGKAKSAAIRDVEARLRELEHVDPETWE